MKAFHKFVAYRIRPVELALLVKKVSCIRRYNYQFKEHVFFIDPVSDFGVRIVNDEHYEQETTHAILAVLEEGDVFVDLGANEGFFSVLASKKVGERGRVISIEPQERLWSVLMKNYFNNNCMNCTLAPYAISNREGETEINLYPSINTGASSIKSTHNSFLKGITRQKQTIKQVTLDHLFESYALQEVKLLKIDIEGFELFALMSGREILKQGKVKNILIETHPEILKSLGQSQEEVFDLLTGMGYQRSPYNSDLFSLAENSRQQ
jgi:FkbM family methyltransferase